MVSQSHLVKDLNASYTTDDVNAKLSLRFHTSRHGNVYYLRFVVEKPFLRPIETRVFKSMSQCQSVVSVPVPAIKVKTWLLFLPLQVYFGPTAAS